MLSSEMAKLYPSAKTLVKEQVASRIHAKDASLYGFSEEAQATAEAYMGWVGLASNPPTPIDEITSFAKEARKQGFRTAILVGQGGSTQAPMTITKYNKEDSNKMSFKTLDSDSPVRVRGILTGIDPETTLVIVSSKSGSTLEPRMALRALLDELGEHLSEDEIADRLIAITDPGSDLEALAKRRGWRKIFYGEPSVGGRYSALSVFGLVPAALVGINMKEFLAHAVEAESRCSEDSIDNPAIALAAFLYDNLRQGRDKLVFLSPKRGRVLGLWIEQLVAESLGKDSTGILPNIETDTLLLRRDSGDREVVTYTTKTDLWDERKNFEMGLGYIDRAVPRMNYRIDNVCELAEHFVMWEYAIAMCGYLMQVCPFDQPDVASAKAEVLDILKTGPVPCDFTQDTLGDLDVGEIEVYLGECFKDKGISTVEGALEELLSSIRPGDYFSLNAFLPFTGEGRREAIELIRHTVADEFNVASCLEVGPRYLHSTGQLHKGGQNKGVFLILSADELKDIPLLKTVAPSMGALAKAQAQGDLRILSTRGRRCIHLHLPDNTSAVLRQLGETVQRVARCL